MTKARFSKARLALGKTQKQMAQLLSTSLKAVQSFEQGWRKVPVHIERQILFLLAAKYPAGARRKSCWDIRDCPPEVRHQCPAWEFEVGRLCWFINGTICHGEVQTSWANKIKICSRCEVYRQTFEGFLA